MIEKYIKIVAYLAAHMDEYTEEEFNAATKETLNNALDDATMLSYEREWFCPYLAKQLRNLYSLYRFTKTNHIG